MKNVFDISSRFLFQKYTDVVKKEYYFLSKNLKSALVRVSCGLVFFVVHP